MLQHPDINQQHDELIRMLHQLSDSIRHGQSEQEIDRRLDEVIAFTRFHLESEEQIMTRFGYPELKWHKDRHKELLDDVLNFKKKLRHVGEIEFIDWFHHWPMSRLQAHIEYADKQAEDYIKQLGGQAD